MQATTIQASTITADPELDMTAGHYIGDEMLLASVAHTKVAKVPAGQQRSESRAWSFGGNVD